MVGSAGSANSTVQVAGSMSLAIKTVTGNYTATGTDNTILANTTSSAIVITLPASNFCRSYLHDQKDWYGRYR